MTVNTANITSGPYSGNDITTAFDYNFRIEDKSQLIVYETDDAGVQTTLTVDIDYTVSGIGVDAGGQVTRVAGALPTGYTWYIRSNYQATQVTAFASQGGFFPDVHELAFDKLTFLIQQLSDGKDRTFKLADSLDVDGDFALLADAAERAGMYLTFDSNGDIAVTTSPQVLTVDGIYDNVTLMRAASLSTGLMIMTRGYTTAGDGDWAIYYIKPPQAFDNIIDHELANGNVAVLQRLSADHVSNTAAGIITSTIQQDVNDELAGFIQTLQNYTAQDWYANTSTHDITVDSDYNLTSAQNLRARIVITDTSVILTTGRNIVVANTARLFIAKNDTAQTLTFKTAAGSGIAVAAGKILILMCDGTNVIEPEIASYDYVVDAISSLAAGSGDKIQYAALATDIGPWHTIDTQTASASATVEFIDGVGGVVFDSTYDEYRVVITHLIPATDATRLHLTVTEDGGTSWVSTNYSQIAATSGITSTTITVAETELRPLTSDNMGNLSTEGCSVEILLKNPSTADRMDHVVVVSGGLYKDQAGAAFAYDGATGFIDRDVAYNGIKFAMSSGDIASGVFTLQGRRY